MRKILLFIAALCCATMVNATEGALPGKFTINAEGDQVQFSQGNLQYRASTNIWRFAESQWNVVGDADKGNVYEGLEKSDNTQIDKNYTGWIDFFGWGTGDKPINASTDDNEYGTFTDWGMKKISNGGNTTNQWRTLTKDEWVFLFHGRANAATLFGLGSMNGINGTILLPDNWILPTGASFTPSTALGLEDQEKFYFNESGNNFTHNTYTKEQWSVMESAGAVFLPAAGYRHGKEVTNVGSNGYYWSATPDGTGFASSMFFYPYGLFAWGHNPTSYGYSVRLVKDVDVHEGIDQVPSDQVQSSKLLRNGVLLIERNGRTYNAQGAEVR